MTLQTVQNTAPGGTAITAAAVAATDTFANDGKVLLKVINGGASPDTVSITPQAKIGGLSLTVLTGSVTNGATKYFGPFDPTTYNDSTGLVEVAHSYTTSVTCSIIHLGS